MPNKDGDKRPRKSRHEEPEVIRHYKGDPEAIKRAIRILMSPRKAPPEPPRGKNR